MNSVMALGGSVIQKLLTLVYFVVVARSYGPVDQGRYSAALAFTTLFGVLVDLGLSSALTREVARSPEKVSVYTTHMLLLRVALGMGVYGLMIWVASFAEYPKELIALIAIAGVAAVIDVVTTSSWAILRGFQNLWYEAVGGVVAISTMIVVGLSAVLLRLPVSALVGAVLAGSIANFLYVGFILYTKAHVSVRVQPQKKIFLYLFRVAFPFAGAALFSRIYTFADTAIVARMAGEHYAGWYAAGNKLVLALNILPASISASIYPAMSASFAKGDTSRIGDITAKALVVLFAMSMPIAVGVALIAPQLVHAFYGSAYGPTTTVLQLLMPGLVFSFLNYPLGALLAATNRQGVNTFLFGIAALTSVSANILLIPSLHADGSAIALTLTMAVLFFGSLIATRKELRHMSVLAEASLKICVSAGLMACALFALRTVSIACTIPIGVAVYGASIFVLRVFSMSEFSQVFLKKV